MGQPVWEKVIWGLSLKMDNRRCFCNPEKTREGYTNTYHSAAPHANNLWLKNSEQGAVSSLILLLSFELYHFNQWGLEHLWTLSS